MASQPTAYQQALIAGFVLGRLTFFSEINALQQSLAPPLFVLEHTALSIKLSKCLVHLLTPP